jgi:hypothetical protein
VRDKYCNEDGRLGILPDSSLFLRSRCMKDKLEKFGIDPESLLPERTRILREGSSPIAHGIDPSNAFWLS